MLLMSLAWPLRGQFGHLPGAMIAGTAAALIPLIVFRGRWLAAAGLALIMSALGFAIGGHLGYGKLFESVEVFAGPGAAWDLMQLFLIGGIWGGIGGTLMGFAFSEKTFCRLDFLVLVGVSAVWYLLIAFVDIEALSLFFFYAGFAIFHVYNFRNKKSEVVTLLGFGSFIGFALAFTASALLLHAGHKGILPGPGWWVLRDQVIGLVGGFFLWLIFSRMDRGEMYPSLMHDVAGLHQIGCIFMIAVVPGVNLVNVLMYWKESGVLLMHQIWFLIAVPSASAFYVYHLLKSRDGFSIRLELTLYRLTIFFFWLLSLTAVAKETFMYGLTRWETAYSQFFISTFALTILLWLCHRPYKAPPTLIIPES